MKLLNIWCVRKFVIRVGVLKDVLLICQRRLKLPILILDLTDIIADTVNAVSLI